MSMTILDPDGAEVEVYVRDRGGVIEAVVRADSRDDFIASAVSQNLMVEETVEGETVRRPAPGVDIDEIGEVTIAAAVLDESGDVVTPARIDRRYHVNLLIGGEALKAETDGYPNWMRTALLWTRYGRPGKGNAAEYALRLGNIEVIDPDTIRSPSRVWL